MKYHPFSLLFASPDAPRDLRRKTRKAACDDDDDGGLTTFSYQPRCRPTGCGSARTFTLFDTRMSLDGTIACASCHDPNEGWSDPRPLSLGVEDREGGRHSMPVQATAFQTFWFWDGRADSLWSQAIKAIESHPEMDFTRVEVARFIAEHYREPYEAIFGALPSLDDLPQRSRPGMENWDALSSLQQESVERIFTNAGKVIEAYERQLLCSDTRFDQWARGAVEMSNRELAGAVTFMQEGCVDCHAGPAFSDGLFHNIGIGSGNNTPDRGRVEGMELLWDDVFSGVGPYSDDVNFGAQKLASMQGEEGSLGSVSYTYATRSRSASILRSSRSY